MDGQEPESNYDIEEISIHENMDIGAIVNFSTKDDQVVLMKTGISYVSVDQARLNMEKEMDQFGWEFDAVHQNARNTWSHLLNKIKIEGGSESREGQVLYEPVPCVQCPYNFQ